LQQKPFVTADTKRKLNTVADYLNAYTTALSKQNFRLHYVDVFAGTGEIPLRSDLPLMAGIQDIETIVSGSARRALEVNIPFHRYIFADLNPNHTQSLRVLANRYPAIKERVEIQTGEANEIVKQFCQSMRWNDRAVLFLDPFGNQVDWETLEIIASTQKIDLWYLFPAGLGVARQISNDGKIQSFSEASLDRLFGECDWRSHCISEEKSYDLFENEITTAIKIGTADNITKFMINRMKKIFRGDVSDKWLPLGRDGRHNFSLIFACSNPRDAAKRLSQRVAKDIMTRK